VIGAANKKENRLNGLSSVRRGKRLKPFSFFSAP